VTDLLSLNLLSFSSCVCVGSSLSCRSSLGTGGIRNDDGWVFKVFKAKLTNKDVPSRSASFESTAFSIQKARCTASALFRLVFPNRVHRNGQDGSEVGEGKAPSIRARVVLRNVVEL